MTRRQAVFAAAFAITAAIFWHLFWAYVAGSFSWEEELFSYKSARLAVFPAGVVRAFVAGVTTMWVAAAFTIGAAVGTKE